LINFYSISSDKDSVIEAVTH